MIELDSKQTHWKSRQGDRTSRGGDKGRKFSFGSKLPASRAPHRCPSGSWTRRFTRFLTRRRLLYSFEKGPRKSERLLLEPRIRRPGIGRVIQYMTGEQRPGIEGWKLNSISNSGAELGQIGYPVQDRELGGAAKRKVRKYDGTRLRNKEWVKSFGCSSFSLDSLSHFRPFVKSFFKLFFFFFFFTITFIHRTKIQAHSCNPRDHLPSQESRIR